MIPNGLEGMVVVVTGAASGIGEASARRFARGGASVVLADIDMPRLRDVHADVVAAGGRAIAVRCDASSTADWAALVGTARERLGPIHVVHNNAYVQIRRPAHEQTDEEWDRQLGVGARQVLLSVRHCIDDLIGTSGAIVNTSSVHERASKAGFVGYAAAKGAVGAMTRQLAVEYGPAVRVNCVVPGPIATPAWNTTSASDQAIVAERTVAGRLGLPDEVAAAVCFLSSPEASYITGASLVVDGGWSVHQ